MKKSRRGEYTRNRRKKYLRLKRAGLYKPVKKAESIIRSDKISTKSVKLDAYVPKTSMYSLTYIGVIITILAGLAKILNLNIGTAELTTTIETIILFIGGIIAFWGRIRVGGVSILGLKKNAGKII